MTISYTETEDVAMSDGIKKAIFMQQVLAFLVPGMTGRSIRALGDNVGGIHLDSNPYTSAWSRHIDVRRHCLRELAMDGSMRRSTWRLRITMLTC